ncbi:hypothetical protein P4V39_18540, partial [Brevibacillus borstelensis]|uniref:hypothetical protein n=1 Tax=Brevibacillus borstelensis TaxID=45462 RepID=UPI002E22070E|nr:hypothetical protein [Brevibacillus borstelensis]
LLYLVVRQLQDTGKRCSGGQLFYEQCTTRWSIIRLAFTEGSSLEKEKVEKQGNQESKCSLGALSHSNNRLFSVLRARLVRLVLPRANYVTASGNNI